MQERILFSPTILFRLRKYRGRKSLNPLETNSRKRYSVAGYVRTIYPVNVEGEQQ